MFAPLDGNGTPTTVFSDVNARGISIDLTNNVLYWAEVINDRIRMGMQMDQVIQSPFLTTQLTEWMDLSELR